MANAARKAPAKGKKPAQATDEGRPEPSDATKKAIELAKVSRAARPARAAVQRKPDSNPKVLRLETKHNDDEGGQTLLAETFGSRSNDFTDHQLVHLAKLTADGEEVSIQTINASLAIIGGIEPRDELEAALAMQIAATHDMSLAMLARAKSAKYLEHVRDFGNLATKMQRTLATMVKTLSDHRRGGEQVVRHLHIYEGGQAVVAGTINQGAVNREIVTQPYGPSAALLGQNEAGYPLPVSSGEGAEAVSPSWRGGGIGGAAREQECDEARGSDTRAPGDDGGA